MCLLNYGNIYMSLWYARAGVLLETTSTKQRYGPVAIVASLGSYFEYYDFFIALLAAGVVWPAVFFKGQPASVALALSIFTYALTYFTRPVGAFVFGHIGDRVGRKRTLYFTMLVMAVGAFGIALLPGITAIGAVAPVLLGLFRLVEGFGLGGEAGGASTWIVEIAAKSRWRGFWASWVQAGSPAGLATASLLTYAMEVTTGAAFTNWGWRIPFFIGGAVALVGAVIRFRLSESRLFEGLRENKKIERMPVVETLKHNWKPMILLSLIAFPEIIGTSVQIVPFSIVYMRQLGITATFTTFVVTWVAFGALCGSILAGVLCDRVGRKPFAIASALFAVLVAFPFFLVFPTKNTDLISIVLFFWGFGVYLENGILPSLLAESFPTTQRYSGSSLGLQFGTLWAGIIVGFVLPVALTSANDVGSKAWPLVASITVVTGIVSLIASIFIKETKDVDVNY